MGGIVRKGVSIFTKSAYIGEGFVNSWGSQCSIDSKGAQIFQKLLQLVVIVV